MAEIDTLETVFGRAVRNAPSPLDFTVRLPKPPNLKAIRTARAGKTLGTVEARINHSRWLIDCPDPDCTAAVLASRTDPRFVCPVCGYGIFTVTFPAEAEAIERTLAERPVPATRNWHPHESIADLRAENKAHRRKDR